MADLKCPYCDEVRPTRAMLTTHVDNVHGSLNLVTRQHDANAHVVLATCEPKCGECDGYPVVYQNYQGANFCVHCANGFPAPVSDDQAAPVPDGQPDRKDLMAEWDRVGKRLEAAQADMRQMREQFDSVDRRLAALDRHLTSPATVRRATLNQVWDRLVDKGEMQAAAIVMDMIRKVVSDL